MLAGRRVVAVFAILLSKLRASFVQDARQEDQAPQALTHAVRRALSYVGGRNCHTHSFNRCVWSL
jgi:hypothetical protein